MPVPLVSPPLPAARLSLLLLGLCACTPKESAYPIVLADANNYAFSGTIHVPAVETAPATDLSLHWETVADDIQCHALDPAADIDTVGMVRFPNLTQEEVADGLSNDTLQESDLSGYIETTNDGGTSTTLASMTLFGTPVDITEEYIEGGGTYLLLLTTGNVTGVGVRTLTFMTPTSTSANTDVNVPTGCGLLDYTVDLHSLTPIDAPTTGPWEADWGGITLDGQGNPVNFSGIDELIIGEYAPNDTAAVEADFLNLQENATHLWRRALTGGTTADLGEATDGETWFEAMDPQYLYLLGLRCTRCYNPAPVFLTVLNPVSDE